MESHTRIRNQKLMGLNISGRAINFTLSYTYLYLTVDIQI